MITNIIASQGPSEFNLLTFMLHPSCLILHACTRIYACRCRWSKALSLTIYRLPSCREYSQLCTQVTYNAICTLYSTATRKNKFALEYLYMNECMPKFVRGSLVYWCCTDSLWNIILKLIFTSNKCASSIIIDFFSDNIENNALKKDEKLWMMVFSLRAPRPRADPSHTR